MYHPYIELPGEAREGGTKPSGYRGQDGQHNNDQSPDEPIHPSSGISKQTCHVTRPRAEVLGDSPPSSISARHVP